MNLPRIELNENDTLWLKTAIDLFLSNKPYRYQDILRLLWGKVPEDYEPEGINHLLLYSGYQPTLYGIWHIYPEDSIFQEVDLVVQRIIDILRKNPATEEVSSMEIATRINLLNERVGTILKLLGSLGNFYRSASSSGSFVGLDNIRFGYNEKEIIQGYRAYRGLENAIKKKVEKDQNRQREYAVIEYRNALNRINELIEAYLDDGHADESLYQELRTKVLESSKSGTNIPESIRATDTLLSLIEYLRADMKPDMTASESSESILTEKNSNHEVDQSLFSETTELISSELSRSEFDSLEKQWKKAYTRCESDPEGAITAAKSLLESTLKTILDILRTEYSDKDDLPKLYSLIKKPLKLNKDDIELAHARKALGSCTNLVHFLSEVRNDLGDAHGRSQANVLSPSKGITRLTISVSGHLSIWLLKRYRDICLDTK